MASFPLPDNEHERLIALQSYHILDTAEEKDFDDLTELASIICGTPIALITLVDKDRQWFKSHKGMSVTETEKAVSFCVHAIIKPDDITVIEDANQDERFAQNPLVTGEAHVVFYAGVPLVNSHGYALGTLCVVDNQAKRLSALQIASLKTLARQVMDKLELRKKVIDLELANQKIEQLNRELVKSEQKSILLLKDAPVAIALLSGRDLIIESANDQMLELWGKSMGIIGMPLRMALPELQGQSFLKTLEEVFTSGMPFSGNEAKVAIERNGQRNDYFFNFVYRPIKNHEGEITDIMIVANEITDLIHSRQQIEHNEHRLHRMIMTAPFGMTILKGRELIVEIANQPMLTIWNRNEQQIIGRRLLDVFPELGDQPFPGMLTGIFDTGKSVAVNETAVNVAGPDGDIKQLYVDFTYDPLFNFKGRVESIMVTVIDITEIVHTRKKLEENKLQLQNLNKELTNVNQGQAAINEELMTANDELEKIQEELHTLYNQSLINENRLQMAADITGLATADIDLLTGSMISSQRYAEIFGYSSPAQLKYEAHFQLIHPEDLVNIVQPAIERSFAEGEFYYDARLTLPGGQLKWIRVKGRTIFNNNGTPVRITLTTIDATEQKLDEQRKNDFIAMVSHELKTPLTSAKGYIQLLAMKADKLKDSYMVEALNRVLLQLNKMNTMISGFLDMSRLESGKLHLDNTEFELNGLLSETITETAFGAPGYHIKFTPCENVIIYADKGKISQVIENLLSNAIKYGPADKNIEVGSAVKDGQVVVQIKDEGVGIKPDDLQKLFDRFYRVENPNTKTVSGFGIGLYLCAEIVRRHNGTIWAESEPGKGSSFYFSLPVVRG